MPVVGLSLSALLGFVFLVAGGAKLARPQAWRRSLVGYRLARPHAVAAVAVPAVEIGIGALLLADVAAAGWTALFLLTAFSLALGTELVAGTPPPGCGCLLPSSRPPGPAALVRNAALAALAAGAALGVRPVLGETFWIATYALLWLAVAALMALVLALYRQVGLLHLRLGPRGAFEHDGEGLSLGEAAPEGFRSTMVVFTSPACPVCKQIVPGLRAVAADHALTVVHAREEDAQGRALHDAFRVPGTPYAVFVGTDGQIRAKGAVNTLEQLEGLIATGLRRETEGRLGHVA